MHQFLQMQMDTEYATRADFCRVFANDMNQLYLLAFLLTANHREAEQCFVSTLEEAPQNNTVFRGWVRSWTKRSLIKIAIRSVFREPHWDKGKRDQWEGEQSKTEAAATIDAITQLTSVDRFVFVMSVLEGYSSKENALLLDCAVETVIKARMRASDALRVLQPIFTAEQVATSDEIVQTASWKGFVAS